MVARRPFWKSRHWKSIGVCLWPPSTCIWNLKLKFQSKLDLCSGNHVVYRQTDGQMDKVNPVYPPSNFVGRGYNDFAITDVYKQIIIIDANIWKLYILTTVGFTYWIVHPSPKAMADFFRKQKSTWCPHPICTIFGGCIKCMQVCINPFCTGVLNTVSVIFFFDQVWTSLLISCWNLSDSNEIF